VRQRNRRERLATERLTPGKSQGVSWQTSFTLVTNRRRKKTQSAGTYRERFSQALRNSLLRPAISCANSANGGVSVVRYTQASQCEGVPVGDCQKDYDWRMHNAELGGRTGRDADGAPFRRRSGVTEKTGHHQSCRIVSFDGAAGGAQRKTLARRQSAAALDRYGPAGSGEEIPTHQGLSRTSVAERTSECIEHSAEGGQDRRSRLNLVVWRLKVPNVESRCNRLIWNDPSTRDSVFSFSSFWEQRESRSRKLLRRLITLIFAGRN